MGSAEPAADDAAVPAAGRLERTILEALVLCNPLAAREADVDDAWLLSRPAAYAALPRQLVRLGLLDRACRLVLSLHFMQRVFKDWGAVYLVEILRALRSALHEGQGRDGVEDAIAFVERCGEGLEEDPSRVFSQARLEPESSRVWQEAVRSVSNADHVVRQVRHAGCAHTRVRVWCRQGPTACVMCCVFRQVLCVVPQVLPDASRAVLCVSGALRAASRAACCISDRVVRH